jgi:hypothetical protein
MDAAVIQALIQQLQEQNRLLAAQAARSDAQAARSDAQTQAVLAAVAQWAPPTSAASAAPAGATGVASSAAAPAAPSKNRKICTVCGEEKDRSSMARHMRVRHGIVPPGRAAAAAATPAATSPSPPPPATPAPAPAAPTTKRGRGRPRGSGRGRGGAQRAQTQRSESPASSIYIPEDSDEESSAASADGDAAAASGAPPAARRGPRIPEGARRGRVGFFSVPSGCKLVADFMRTVPALVHDDLQEEINKAMSLLAQGVAFVVAARSSAAPRAPTAAEVDRHAGDALATETLNRITEHFKQSGCAEGTAERYFSALEASGVLHFLQEQRRVGPEAAQAVAALKKAYCKRGVMTNKHRCNPADRLEGGFAPDKEQLEAYVLLRMTGPEGMVACMTALAAAAPPPLAPPAAAATLTRVQFQQINAAVFAVIALASPAMRSGVWMAMTVTRLLENLNFDLTAIRAGIVARSDFTAAELDGLSTIVFALEGDKTARIYGVASIAVTAELAALLRLFVRFRARALSDCFGVDAPSDLLFVNSAGGPLTNLSVHTRTFTEAAAGYTNPATGAPFPTMNMPPNGFRAVQTTAEARASTAVPDSARAALVAATQNHTKAVAASAAYTLIDPRERALRDYAALRCAGVHYMSGYLTSDQTVLFS